MKAVRSDIDAVEDTFPNMDQTGRSFKLLSRDPKAWIHTFGSKSALSSINLLISKIVCKLK